MGERNLIAGLGSGVARLPAIRLVLGAQAQGVVVDEQGMQRLLQDRRTRGWRSCRSRPGSSGAARVAAAGRTSAGWGSAAWDPAPGPARPARWRRADHGGQLGDGLVLEEMARRERKSGGVGSGHDLNGQDRIAAQFKEVVVDADLLELPAPGPRSLPAGASAGVSGDI